MTEPTVLAVLGDGQPSCIGDFNGSNAVDVLDLVLRTGRRVARRGPAGL